MLFRLPSCPGKSSRYRTDFHCIFFGTSWNMAEPIRQNEITALTMDTPEKNVIARMENAALASVHISAKIRSLFAK